MIAFSIRQVNPSTLIRGIETTETHLGLVLSLQHRQELGDDLVRHTLDVRTSLDRADGIDVRHLLEHAVRAEGHANLVRVRDRTSVRGCKGRRSRKKETRERVFSGRQAGRGGEVVWWCVQSTGLMGKLTQINKYILRSMYINISPRPTIIRAKCVKTEISNKINQKLTWSGITTISHFLVRNAKRRKKKTHNTNTKSDRKYMHK